MAERGWSGWVRYGLPGLALGLGLAWGLGERGPAVRAQGPGPGQGVALGGAPLGGFDRQRAATAAAESSGTIALTSSTNGTAQLLTLIDTKTRAFAVYRIDPANPKGMVKLEATRQYQWDLKLSEYNNLEPAVSAIESTVRSVGQPDR